MKKITLLSVLFFVICTNIYALTLSEIREQIRYDIHDTTDTVNINTLFSDDFIDTRINMVQDEIVDYTHPLMGRCLITPVTNYQEYRLPTDCIAIDRVSFISTSGSTTTYKRLIGRIMPGLDKDYPTWESTSAGLPRAYYVRRNYLGLYPKPSSTYSQEKAIKLDYYKRADSLTADSQEPFDGDYSLRLYHRLIIDGVVIKIKKTMGLDYAIDKAVYEKDLERMKQDVKFMHDIDIDENITGFKR